MILKSFSFFDNSFFLLNLWNIKHNFTYIYFQHKVAVLCPNIHYQNINLIPSRTLELQLTTAFTVYLRTPVMLHEREYILIGPMSQ